MNLKVKQDGMLTQMKVLIHVPWQKLMNSSVNLQALRWKIDRLYSYPPL